ncbi:MAG: hypothetical protein IPJ84_21070 [Bdellovibrionales bacterium]|nr:hypothetical protein [Bdellovibrionales bacterium]
MKRSSAIAAPTSGGDQKDSQLLSHLDEALLRIRREDEAIRQQQMDSAAERSLRLLRVLSETVIEQRVQGRAR